MRISTLSRLVEPSEFGDGFFRRCKLPTRTLELCIGGG
jgi:hypothetical protein